MKKPNLTLKLIIPIFCGILLYGLYNFFMKSNVRDWDEIVESKVINIATPYNLIDFTYGAEGFQGFQYELLNAILDSKGVDINIQPIADFDSMIEGLIEGKYDLLAAPIPNTTELKERIALTSPILKNNLVLVQRNDSTALADSLYINSQLQLARKEIYVLKNSPSILRLENLSNEIGDTIFYKELDRYGDEQLISLVAHGDINYAICDERIASRMADSIPHLDTSLAIGFTQLYSWAVNQNAIDLLEQLNTWIQEFIPTPEYTEIYTKYFKSQPDIKE